jgi:hypothetical protein
MPLATGRGDRVSENERVEHWVHRIEGGRIVYTASFPSRNQALEVAGIKD